jgi:hypothetical protein
MPIKVIDWNKETQTEAAVEITTIQEPIVETKTVSQIGAEIQQKEDEIAIRTREIELANEEIANNQLNINECEAEVLALEALLAQIPAKPVDFDDKLIEEVVE